MGPCGAGLANRRGGAGRGSGRGLGMGRATGMGRGSGMGAGMRAGAGMGRTAANVDPSQLTKAEIEARIANLEAELNELRGCLNK